MKGEFAGAGGVVERVEEGGVGGRVWLPGLSSHESVVQCHGKRYVRCVRASVSLGAVHRMWRCV